MVLPCLYNAPVSWYALALAHRQSETVIEQHDHYTKQTYRNRCRIMGANGPIDLVIPVVKNHGHKTFMKDIRIEPGLAWSRNHWRSIESAYASSPYFEYMQDAFSLIYQKTHQFLIDLNLQLIEQTIDQLQIDFKFSLSGQYSNQESELDPREQIHPKKPFRHPHFDFRPVVYQQVFADRQGFLPDLSVIDLLFNAGPEALSILKRSIRTVS